MEEKRMTSQERIRRMFEHREADRVPIIDSPWRGTIARWEREGMPAGTDWSDWFGADKWAFFSCDTSPRCPVKVLEETDRYVITTTAWGATLKNFKHEDSTPEFLDYTYKTSEKWEECKARILAGSDRIPWDTLKKEYPRWKAEGQWTQMGFWFGFDVAHSYLAGIENILIAMLEEPEWVSDIFNTYLDRCISLFEEVYNAGYRFDSVYWWDDMGYKGRTFFSKELYREILKPVQKRAVDWAHEHGMYACLHSCGYIRDFIPELVDVGIDYLNPLEVKAGMDPVEVKRTYGDRLVLHGGVNAVLWDDRDAILAEIERVLPVLKEGGGYIFASDHSIPNSVSLENMRAILGRVKELGKY
jgi:uroporphyrinogen decarboxylase